MESAFEQTLLRLGWTLIHFVWQGTLVAGLCASFLAAFRNASAATRYVCALTCLVILALLPVATYFYLDGNQAQSDASGITTLRNIEVAASTSMSAAAVASQWPLNLEARLEPVMPWLVAGWLSGVIILLLRLYTNIRQVAVLRRSAQTLNAGEWLEILQRLCQARILLRNVKLAVSHLIATPIIIGWLKPIILIPPSLLTGLTPQQIEMILAHELAHIYRHDHLVNMLQVLVETVLFYHPAVHWISRRVRLEREKCCDDITVARCGNPLAYARTLARLDDIRAQRFELSLGIAGGELLDRIQRLVTKRPQVQAGSAWLMSGMMIGLLVAIALPMQVAVENLALQQNSAVTTAVKSDVAEISGTAGLGVIPGKESLPNILILDNARDNGAEKSTAFIDKRESGANAVPDMPTEPPAMQTGGIADAQIATDDRPEEQPVIQRSRPQKTEAADIAPAMDRQVTSKAVIETASTRDAEHVIGKMTDIPLSVRPSPVFTGGQLLNGTTPIFPKIAAQEKIQGKVTVSFTVTETGQIKDAFIVSAQPTGVFEQAALDAIEDWRFEPLLMNGEPVPRQARRVFEFSVETAERPGQSCIATTGSRLCRDIGRPEQHDMMGVKVIYLRP